MAQQLTGLHAKFTGDSSGFVRATKLAQFEINKLDAKTRAAKRDQDALAASGAGLAKEYHRLRMETDGAYAAQVRFEKAAQLVRRTAEAQQWSTEQLNAELMRLAGHYQVAEAAGLSMNEQVRAGRFHTANLAAQFNDIGVMLAAGQSPFMLAVQQGTQITQVLQDMGGGTKQTFAALGSAFMSLLSPVSLLTIGVIAGGAALIQWGMSALGAKDEAQKLADQLDALETSFNTYMEYINTAATNTGELQTEFGAFSEQVQSFAAYMAEVQLGQVFEEVKTVIEPLKGDFAELETRMGQLAEAQAYYNKLVKEEADYTTLQTALGTVEQLTASVQGAARAIGLTSEQAAELARLFDQLESANSMEEIAIASGVVLDFFRRIAPEGQKLPPALRAAAEALESLRARAAAAVTAAERLKATAPTAGWMGVAIGETNALISRLIEANRQKDKLATPLSTSPRPRRAPAGEGGVDWGVAPDPGGGGGVGGADPIEAELERLRESLLTKEEEELASYLRRQETLRSALEQKYITQTEYDALMEQEQARHVEAMNKFDEARKQSALSGFASMFGDLSSLMTTNNKKLFQIGKAAAIAEAVVSGYSAAVAAWDKGMKIGGPPVAAAFTAASLAKTGALIAGIKSQQFGGGGTQAAAGGRGAAPGATTGATAAPQTSNISLQLVGGDLFSRDQVIRLINSINEATADGARIILR